MKYYIGKIQESRGEFENYETILFKTDECPDAYLDILAYEWYDLNPSMKDLLDEPEWAEDFFKEFKNNGYQMWNDYMTYCAGSYYEVPKDVWDCLQDKRIHSDLYITGEGNSVKDWVKLKEMYL